MRRHYDLSNIDFSRLRAEFERSPYKQVLMLNLREKIEERLAMMLAANPTRTDLYERYQEIVQEYNKDRDEAEIQCVFDDLTAYNANLDYETRRYVREELDNEEQLAVFDLLQKDSLSRSERESIKKTAVDLLAKLQDIQSQIDHSREKASAQAQVRAEIIKHLFANMPGDRYSDDEISQKADVLFAHIYTTLDAGASVTTH